MLNLALKANQFANNGQSQVFQNWQDYFSGPKESKYAILFQKGFLVVQCYLPLQCPI